MSFLSIFDLKSIFSFSFKSVEFEIMNAVDFKHNNELSLFSNFLLSSLEKADIFFVFLALNLKI